MSIGIKLQANSVRDSIKRLIETEILDRVDEWYEGGGPSVRGLIRKFGEAQLLSLNLSADCGGSSPDVNAQLLLAEELGRVKCVSLVGSIAVQAQFATAAVARHAAASVQGEFLAPAIAGLSVAGRAIQGHEHANSLRIRKQGSDYLLSASSLRVANAPDCDWMVLDCENPDVGSAQQTIQVLVPSSLPGVRIEHDPDSGRPIPKYACSVTLDSVRVPARYLMRPESQKAADDLRSNAQLFAATLYLSRAEDIITLAGDFLCSRGSCSRSGVSTQYLSATLAKLQTEVVSARALIAFAAQKQQAASDAHREVIMARYKVCQLARSVPILCLNIWGRPVKGADNFVVRLSDDMNDFPLDGVFSAKLVRELARDLGFEASTGTGRNTTKRARPAAGRLARS